MPHPEARSESTEETDDDSEAERPGPSPGRSVPKGRIRMPDFEGLPDAEEISAEVDDRTSDAIYANSVRVQRSPEEYILDFVRVIPGVMDIRLESRVIVSPKNAERLHEALAEHLESVDQPGPKDENGPPSPSPPEPESNLGPPADLGPANGHNSFDNSNSHSVPTVEPEVLTATFSDSGEAVHCNSPWTSLLGPTERPWARLSEEDRDMVESAVLEALKGSLVTNRLIQVQTDYREEPLPILLNFIPVPDESGDGDEYRAATVSGEVLAEPPSWMLSQTQRHRMETLGRMTMGVAHDLNNLLSGLLGHIELLKNQLERASLTDSIRPSIETIETTAEDGASLIEKLQRYIRHDTQQHFEPVDVNELIEDCITLTEPYWYNEPRRQGIEITVKTSFEDLPNILGAASELREVFVNLILNAVQAMPEGGTLRFETFTTERGQVGVNVSDTGIGMSDEVQKNIFEPLFTTKGDDGTGMGLAASYGIVQEHQGTIDVRSEPDEGTEFTLRFPPAEGAPAPAEDTPTPDEESSAPEPVTSEGASILVVDDDEMVRSTVTRLLTLSGHDVDRASTGAEALSMFPKHDYDIVFTDFGMPEMTGAELARTLKDDHPDLPIILLTGYTDTETAIDEVDGILSKPFKRDELETAIQKHVFS